eukprot:COSAG06_NODE_1109_length_10653_cov_103.721148_8_plen_103_part_00
MAGRGCLTARERARQKESAHEKRRERERARSSCRSLCDLSHCEILAARETGATWHRSSVRHVAEQLLDRCAPGDSLLLSAAAIAQTVGLAGRAFCHVAPRDG